MTVKTAKTSFGSLDSIVSPYMFAVFHWFPYVFSFLFILPHALRGDKKNTSQNKRVAQKSLLYNDHGVYAVEESLWLKFAAELNALSVLFVDNLN